MTRISSFAIAAVVATLTGLPFGAMAQAAFQSPVPEACRAPDPQEQNGIDRQMADRQLDPTARIPRLEPTSTTLRGVLATISNSTGLTITFDQTLPELTKAYSTDLTDVLLTDALKTVLGGNALAFTVQGSRRIFVYSDTPENRRRFGESIRCFEIKSADVRQIVASLNQTVLVKMSEGVRPVVVSSRSPARLIVRATPEKMTEIQKFIEANDKR